MRRPLAKVVIFHYMYTEDSVSWKVSVSFSWQNEIRIDSFILKPWNPISSYLGAIARGVLWVGFLGNDRDHENRPGNVSGGETHMGKSRWRGKPGPGAPKRTTFSHFSAIGLNYMSPPRHDRCQGDVTKAGKASQLAAVCSSHRFC